MKLFYKKGSMLILALTLIAIFAVGCKNSGVKDPEFTEETKETKETKENSLEGDLANKVAVSINDTKVYADEVVLWQAVLEDNAGITEWSEEDKTQVMETLKGRLKEIVVLVEMAKIQKMTITDEEMKAKDLEAEEFFKGVPESIKTAGVTLETAKRAFYNDALVGKVFDKKVEDYIPTDEEITTALNEDQTYVDSVTKEPEYFMQQVTVKHILIKTVNDDAALTPKTEEEIAEATTKANDIFAKAKSGDDFVALVKEFTEDTASIATDGEMTFGRTEMVPEFEEAAYNMEIGELRLVKTQFGWHIMRLEAKPEITTEDYEAYQTSLEQYKEEAWTSMSKYLQSTYFWDYFEVESGKYTVNYVEDVWSKIEIGTIFN